MENVQQFLADLDKRRSCYALSSGCPLSDEEIIQLVQSCVRSAPSAFNCQSARVLILLGEAHRSFWHLTEDALRHVVPAEQFEPTHRKIIAFEGAHGTILYFEDWETTDELQAKYPTYHDSFPIWAQQANGMLQYMVWTALAQAGVGASLQHYNPLVDGRVRLTFDVPKTWKLIAQMPFGTITQPPGPKEYVLTQARVRVIGQEQ